MKFTGDFRTFSIIFVGLFVWFFFIAGSFTTFFGNNTQIAFIVFVFGYIGIIMEYVFHINIRAKPKIFLAYVLVFLVFDIILFPLMIGMNSQPALPSGAELSSDVFIYNLLPVDWPQQTKYFIVYVLAPTLMLFVAYALAGEKKLGRIIEEAL